MNYAQMSDFEINKAVAIARGYAEENCDFGWTGKPNVGVEWSEETGYPTKSFNYCNSWADAGPIIERERITLDSDIDVWFARDDNCCHTHENPLRAAMVVFLMMQEGE